MSVILERGRGGHDKSQLSGRPRDVLETPKFPDQTRTAPSTVRVPHSEDGCKNTPLYNVIESERRAGGRVPSGILFSETSSHPTPTPEQTK